jgi:signal transduction protein with GAF and PtsI domain
LITSTVIVSTTTTIVRLPGTTSRFTSLPLAAICLARALRNLDNAAAIAADLVSSTIAVTTARNLSSPVDISRTRICLITRLNTGTVKAQITARAVGVATTGRHPIFAAVAGHKYPGRKDHNEREIN